ncbi:RHS repeat domain-containing protein, partial [Pectobacterium polonicum]
WEVAAPEQQILSRALSYTAAGELASVKDTLRGDVQYDYDAEGRLLKRIDVHWQVHHRAYGYDAADNIQDSNPSASAFPLFDNRLLNWRNLWNQYDGQGNLIRRRDGGTEQFYRYDADNRLLEARGRGPLGEFVARYGYDALGRRTRKTVIWGENGKQDDTHFLWEGFRLLQARHADRTESYVYDPNVWWSPLARITRQAGAHDGDIRWFNTDLNGAPLEMTDADGAVRWSGDYGTFGAVNGQTQDSAALRHGKPVEPQPLRYAGQYADDETGLHYNLFRYYDPTVGRFTTQDPIGLAGGDNLYQYAPNPIRWVDPLGLEKIVRGMTNDNGSPKVGPSARELGARPGTDIKVDANGNVHPNSGGVSVSPNTDGLPNHRKPPEFGGTGKDPVWELDTSDLGKDLKHVPDSRTHGTIQPSRTMSVEEYQRALASTKGKWKLCQ